MSAQAGNGHSLILDAAGDLWTTNNDGLHCVLEDKSVLAIAAGGDENSIAIASAPSGLKSLQRQFSVEMPDSKSVVDVVDSLLEELESNEAISKAVAGQQIAKKSEELLRHPSVLNMILNPMQLETMFERMLVAGDLATRQIIANSIERGL